MNLAAALFQTSIGRKIIMAVTGLVLVVFVAGHLIGNLHIFGAPDEINGYSHFLQGLGPLLWVARIGLLVCAALHIWAAVVLSRENWAARPDDYERKRWIQASIASRWMRLTGLMVLFFILYHLAHFTFGVQGEFFRGDSFKSRLAPYTMQEDFHLAGMLLVTSGTEVDDVHTMMVRGFQSPVVSIFYIIAVGLLAFHLWHGIESMFQTLGLRTSAWSPGLRGVARLFCLLYFLGNLAIPGAVLAGIVKPHEGAVAAVPIAAAPDLPAVVSIAATPQQR